MTHRNLGIAASLLSIAVSVMGAARVIEIPARDSTTPSDPALAASLDRAQLLTCWLSVPTDPRPVGDAGRVSPAIQVSATTLLGHSPLRGDSRGRSIQADDRDAPALSRLCRFLT